MVAMAAVGQEGGLETLVDQVVGPGAFGLIVVVPGLGAGLDEFGVFVGQREGLGPQAMRKSIFT